MASKHPNENIPIVVVPGEAGGTCTAAELAKIRKAITEALLVTSKEVYRKAQIEVERGPDGRPLALVASLLRAHTYTADIIRLEVDAEYRVRPDHPPSAGAG